MSTKTIIECDVCRIIKKEVNHWWKVWISDAEFRSAPSEAFKDQTPPNVKDICGKQHAIEMYNRYLETGQLDKPVYNEPEFEPEPEHE